MLRPIDQAEVTIKDAQDRAKLEAAMEIVQVALEPFSKVSVAVAMTTGDITLHNIRANPSYTCWHHMLESVEQLMNTVIKEAMAEAPVETKLWLAEQLARLIEKIEKKEMH